MSTFTHLFAPLHIRGKRLKRRRRCRPDRAAVAGVHDSVRYTAHVLMATDDSCIEGYRQLAETCHAHDAVVLSQIFHPRRDCLRA